ncbi:SRPBCC family protein [Ekhidna sp.]
MNHYTTSFEINRSAADVFSAISTQLEAWWGHQDHPITQLETAFKVSWGKPWYQFKVIAYQKDKEMIWECIDANQIINGLEGVQKEWVGTKVHWRLTSLDGERTRLDFEHEGLVPDFICFDICINAWSGFLEQHLVSYLEN